MKQTRFLSCDWGTSRFRLRLIEQDANGLRVLGERVTDDGCRELSSGGPEAFARCLESQRAALLEGHTAADALPTVISGMASASIGWRELPYAPLPCRLSGEELHVATLPTAQPTLLVSGLKSEADVMRGEECELVGLAAGGALAAGHSGWVMLPGTHSKHVQIRDGRIVDFRTHMTGELFEILSRHSILRASVTAESIAGEEGGFQAGVEASADPALSHTLFTTRTNQLFARLEPAANRAYLSGLLIGHELRDLCARAGDAPLLLGSGTALADAYTSVLRQLGAGSRLQICDATLCALAVPHAHARLLHLHHRQIA